MIDRPGESASLVPDPPRLVPRRFYLRRMRAMFFCGVLFTTLGIGLGVGLPLFFYVLGGGTLPTADSALDRNHTSAMAIITDKEFMRHTHINGRHPWKVTFRFTDAAGKSVDATGFSYDPSFGDKVAGDTIEVEYDPAQPTWARPVGGSASLLPLWVYLLTIALLGPEIVAGPVLLVVLAVRARNERILLTYGTGVEAEVMKVKRLGYIHFGSQSPYDVHYAFSDHLGRRVVGRDRTYHYAWAEALKPGDLVGVVYHPQAPGANVLWLHGADGG